MHLIKKNHFQMEEMEMERLLKNQTKYILHGGVKFDCLTEQWTKTLTENK